MVTDAMSQMNTDTLFRRHTDRTLRLMYVAPPEDRASIKGRMFDRQVRKGRRPSSETMRLLDILVHSSILLATLGHAQSCTADFDWSSVCS